MWKFFIFICVSACSINHEPYPAATQCKKEECPRLDPQAPTHKNCSIYSERERLYSECFAEDNSWGHPKFDYEKSYVICKTNDGQVIWEKKVEEVEIPLPIVKIKPRLLRDKEGKLLQ